MFEEPQRRIFRVTTKDVIKRLESLSNISCVDLQEEIENCFDNYNVEGEEELFGQENWCDYTKDGKYELYIGINYEGAYHFTIYIDVLNNKASVVNVL